MTPDDRHATDDTFEGRVGWKAIVVRTGHRHGRADRHPDGDPTGGLRRYPRDLLASPVDRRTPASRWSLAMALCRTRAPSAPASSESRTASDGFAGLFADAASGQGVLLALLAVAFGWGRSTLSPGHGKAMVAAYLIGTRGTGRDAVLLGATVTVTHTIGVFALGFVTLGLSQYVLPEDLYPWLTLVSGLMVVVVGAGVLRSRCAPRSTQHSHEHDARAHPHQPQSTRGVLSMGAAAGLIPCPSALSCCSRLSRSTRWRSGCC